MAGLLSNAKIQYFWSKIKAYVDGKVATDSDYGLIKTNSSQNITLNNNGQLDVGGRLGAFPTTTGIFHSKDREPRSVGEYTLLITDSKGMYVSGARDLTIVTGVNLTLKSSHAAGSKAYQVTNNYANRIACYVLKNGGYIALSEEQAKLTPIIPVTSVTINGSESWTPDSSANSSTPIIINVDESANPDTAVTQLRIFGSVTGGFCSEYIGQCVGGTVGASLVIGQRVYSSSNANCIVAADTWNSGNGNGVFGRQHISRKNRGLLAGTGHDTTNARSEGASAVGQWSYIDSNTLFAIGNGTSHTVRSNALEVVNDGVIMKSPNGTRYKLTVDDSGNLSTSAV